MSLEEYKVYINQQLKQLDHNDMKFLNQLCTIIMRHLQKKRGR